MTKDKARDLVLELMGLAGVTVNGHKPFDIKVHNEDFYGRVLKGEALALGESYMEKWWDCQALDQFITKILLANLADKVRVNWKLIWHLLKPRIFNLQKISRAFLIGKQHYDIGNDLYKLMLDKRLVYTSGYWKNAENLDEAQEAKLDLVCRKIGLEQGMKVLDLGCGWGSFAKYAAERYGVTVTGVTVSKQQVELGKELCKGLPVEIKLKDYRNVGGKYDRVISIGIMEHVGYKNYRTYMEKVYHLLTDDGIAFVHTIGNNISKTPGCPWVTKYIFPNSMLPSIAQIGKSMEGLFVMEDWHNFGEDYDTTLMAWHANFEKAWPKLKNRYDDRFYRMWRYYLLGFAGAFRSRSIQLWQIVMTKQGKKQPDCRMS
ncbi:MAG: cyclopropane fatty acyl phospholipid synthase [Deltaproteobacteria bacterium]|jgi:cyclopropane-fatty-acyl-phospholipid synthase|nr:cyclopropane fatty acyl phospholipid synthase [Deltaproteobacteria bacterium]MDL1987847.1 cyclopropane fatty acyl phospholipid synthase [Deltaproteobacteria bacterium]